MKLPVEKSGKLGMVWKKGKNLNFKEHGIKNFMDLSRFIDDLKANNISWDQPIPGNFEFDSEQDFEAAKKLLE